MTKPIDIVTNSADMNRCGHCEIISKTGEYYCTKAFAREVSTFNLEVGQGINEPCSLEDWRSCPLNR